MEAEEGADVPLQEGLSLTPRRELQFSFLRRDNSPLSLSEWQLKQTLLEAFKRHAGLSLTNERDLIVKKDRDMLKKRKDEQVASATLNLVNCKGDIAGKAAAIREKMRSVEIRVDGSKLLCQTSLPAIPMFRDLEEKWENKFGFSGPDGYKSCRPGDRPDTLRIKGIPSRWLAEPRVSPNPSLLVTHTLLSAFGSIRKVEILGFSDISKAAREISSLSAESLGAKLQCEVVVQYEDYAAFCRAVRAFAGRALKKEGSVLIATYELECDESDFFSEKNARMRKFEKERREEEAKRREADEERRRAIEARKAELARLEKERREAEEREQQLREEEERLRREEEERIRLEEEERRQEEERLRLEEEMRLREEWEAEQERLREEEERRRREAEEAERKEEEERRAAEEERRVREEQRVRLEEEVRRLRERKREEAEQEERRAREHRLRAQLEERMRERQERERNRPYDEGEYRGSLRWRGEGGREEEEGGGRWTLDGTQSAASIESAIFLKRSAEEISKAAAAYGWSRLPKRKGRGSGGEGEEGESGEERGGSEEGSDEEREEEEEYSEGASWSQKRLRSMVVSVQ